MFRKKEQSADLNGILINFPSPVEDPVKWGREGMKRKL